MDDTSQIDDEHEDAELDESNLPSGDAASEHISLEKALEEAQEAVNCFFNNQFEEAKKLLVPRCKTSIYHALGNSVFLFLEAILTFEPHHIASASISLKQTLLLCHEYRRRSTLGDSFGKMLGKSGCDNYTELEAHAELCYAECLLLRAILVFMEDETLGSFIKASFKINSCYQSYKDCQNIVDKCNWSSTIMKNHFDGGVKMGIGTFNLMISMLPSRVIKLLEFIGFSGNKELGLIALCEGYQMVGLRQILCIMTLLGYNLVVRYVLSHGEGDLAVCEQILSTQLQKFPQGVWFLFFKGRLEFVKGNLEKSIEWYSRSWKSQSMWPQFHHICFWEMLWIYCLKGDWRRAVMYCDYLLLGSRWSRTIYSYQKAVLLTMIRPVDTNAIDALMKDVPRHKQRIAGKSLPMEKFTIRKAERYFNQNHQLILPVLELMYIWNIFKTMKSFRIADGIFKLTQQAFNDLTAKAGVKPDKYDADNRALVMLLQAACLRRMNGPLQSLQCLEYVIRLKDDLVEDTYLVPYAIVELGLIEYELGNKEKAIRALEDAK